MGSQLPQISVIMPVFNGEKYLAEAIESVRNQTFTDFELIILNDKSTDRTKDIILSYQAKEPRIVFVDKETNVGPATLRNEGFDLAKGEFIALLDADDLALPTRFEKQIQVMQNHTDIGVCGSWFTTFGENQPSKIVKHPEKHNLIKVSFLADCTIGNSTAFFRKSILDGLRYDKAYVPAEDYHLWSRLIVKTKFYILQESLVKYRIHDANISQTKIDNVRKSTRKIKIDLLKQFGIEENNPDLDIFIYLIEGQAGLDFETIQTVCRCDTFLREQNAKLQHFDGELLDKLLRKSMVRIVRKAEKINPELLSYIRKNKPGVYKHIQFFDKLILQLKALLK